jgi:hypothetical protein
VAAGAAPGADGAADAERRRWFYTPTDHGGPPLRAQRPAQQQLALRLVATGLSTPGYVTVATILGLDNVLDQAEGFSVQWGRERGRDPGMYYLRVFGEPGGTGAWGWRFGGHHISLNNLVVDGAVRATTPCFLGADPARSPLLGPTPLRPLAGAEDLARARLADGWAGPTGLGQPLYYRVQGPRLLIEYDNVQRGANHAHSVWRDPAADFGADVLGEHLAEHHR